MVNEPSCGYQIQWTQVSGKEFVDVDNFSVWWHTDSKLVIWKWRNKHKALNSRLIKT